MLIFCSVLFFICAVCFFTAIVLIYKSYKVDSYKMRIEEGQELCRKQLEKENEEKLDCEERISNLFIEDQNSKRVSFTSPPLSKPLF